MLTLILVLSDGVVDVLVTCMDARVLGAGAEGRYTLNRAVYVFSTFFFNPFSCSWVL